MKYHVLVFGLIAAIITACSPSASPTATPAPLTPVSVQMSWTYDYSSAPFFAAEMNGHFKQEGLQVTLVEGGFGSGGYIEPIDAVLNGESEIGLASATTILEKRAEGKPIVAIGSVLQRSPFALISLADKNIVRPQDLVGHTVTVSQGGAMQVYMALLASQKIDPAEVNTIERTSYGIEPLLTGEVDVLGGWIINEGVLVKEAGKEANFILMSDYGVDTYDFVVFTTEDIVKTRPEIVQHFMNALTAGITDVINNPQQGVEFTLHYNPELKSDEQQRRLEAAIPLMNVPGVTPGSMQTAVWDATYNMLVSQGGLADKLDYAAAYTLDFVKSTGAQ